MGAGCLHNRFIPEELSTTRFAGLASGLLAYSRGSAFHFTVPLSRGG